MTKFMCACGLWSALQESFSLWETKKWLKAVMKGDSVLFICRFGVSSLSLPRPLSTQAPIIISYFSCNLPVSFHVKCSHCWSG